MHVHFSVSCFNKVWDLIEKKERTPKETLEMIQCAHASLWHWIQRKDCTDKNLSIGYWQLSRVYSLSGDAENARKYAQLCLDSSPPNEPFFVGYAYEALARSLCIEMKLDEAKLYITKAEISLQEIKDEEGKNLLKEDIKSLQETYLS